MNNQDYRQYLINNALEIMKQNKQNQQNQTCIYEAYNNNVKFSNVSDLRNRQLNKINKLKRLNTPLI